MNRVQTIIQTVPRLVHVVVVQGPPIVILREATLVERFVWWLNVRRCDVVFWANEHMTWRARGRARDVIERVK